MLLVLLVVQPATNKEATTTNRITIAVIGLNCIIGHLCEWRSMLNRSDIFAVYAALKKGRLCTSIIHRSFLYYKLRCLIVKNADKVASSRAFKTYFYDSRAAMNFFSNLTSCM